MKYFLVLLLAILPLLANAQDDIAPSPIVAEVPQILPPSEDDAYSPTRVLEQVAPNFPQEQLPIGFEEPAIVEEAAPAPVAEPEPIAPEMIEGKKATLQILDKIDARVKEIEVELDKEKEYQALKIEVKRCVRSPQESKEENMAFMRIWDVGQGDYTNIIFSGWMFSSNPALHSFEHSIYDIVLLKCSD